MSKGHFINGVLDRMKAATPQSQLAVYLTRNGPSYLGPFEVEFANTARGKLRVDTDPNLVLLLSGKEEPSVVKATLKSVQDDLRAGRVIA